MERMSVELVASARKRLTFCGFGRERFRLVWLDFDAASVQRPHTVSVGLRSSRAADRARLQLPVVRAEPRLPHRQPNLGPPQNRSSRCTGADPPIMLSRHLRSHLIVAPSTSVGKSIFSTGLVRASLALGEKVGYLKPVGTGSGDGDDEL